MKKILIILGVLSALRTSSVQAAEPPQTGPEAGAILLGQALGPEAVSLLKKKGYIILPREQGKKENRRLEYVASEALKNIAAQSSAASALARAYEQFTSSRPGEAPIPPSDFSSLARLPATGLMTPQLHLLRLLLTASHDEKAALAESGAVPLASAGASLFKTRWGKEFSKRTRADSVSDPDPLLEPYFNVYLAGPNPDADAQDHFTDYVLNAYHKKISDLLAADIRQESLSEELRSWLRKYFIDQRRLYAIDLNKIRLAEMDKKGALSKDVKNLNLIAGVLNEHPDLLDTLQGVLKDSPPGRVFLTSAGLHLQKPLKLGRHELGDTVTLSAGYWVDGLKSGEKAYVEETSFVDNGPEGLSEIESFITARTNGGPYPLIRPLLLKNSKSFSFRFAVGVHGGNSLSDSIEVPVADDFEKALVKTAEAENQALSCDFKSAGDAFVRLESEISDAAGEKRQYKDLLTSLRSRKKSAVKNAAVLAKLEQAVELSRDDASARQCRYETQRTEAAVKTVLSLPAGCDKFLPGLNKQWSEIARRRDDRNFFAQSVERGKRLRQSCKFSSAAEEWSNALAVLDAAPDARCGALSQAAKNLEEELVVLRLEEVARAELEGALAKAERESSAGALKSLIARASALPTAACFEKEIARASKLGLEWGQNIPPPSEADAAKKLAQEIKN